jgi:hypothetical protein
LDGLGNQPGKQAVKADQCKLDNGKVFDLACIVDADLEMHRLAVSLEPVRDTPQKQVVGIDEAPHRLAGGLAMNKRPAHH